MARMCIYSWCCAAAVITIGGRVAADERPFHEISRDLSSLIRREATAGGIAARAAAIQAMTHLYVEIMEDERRSTSDTLESYRVKLRSRLLKIQHDLEREIAQDARLNSPPKQRAASSSSTTGETTHRLWEIDEQVAAMYALSSESMGGAGRIFSSLGSSAGGLGGGARPADYGPALVDLIQRTINPEFWDVNGGPGTIVYYPQWYALVVRATAEVHHKIGGILGGG